MNAKQETFLTRVAEELNSHGFVPASILDLAHKLHAPPQAIKAILELGTSHGQIVSLGSELFYSRVQLEEILRHLVSSCPKNGFDGPTFRKEVGLSRRLADTLFQYIEHKGFVSRNGARWIFTEQPQREEE